MISCKHCATANSLDSTFCKKCGTPLPEEDLKAGQEKLEILIAEGVTLYNAGKVEEAMAVAEAAVESNPSSVPALALKGDAHAARGEVAEAIECYEKIVALAPDSTLDKLRLNQLRNNLVLHAQPVSTDRRPAILAGIAALVLVASLATLWARQRSTPQPVVSNAPVETPGNAEFYQPAPPQETPSGTANPAPSNPPAPANPAPSEPAPLSGTGLPPAPSPRQGLPRVQEGVEPSVSIEPFRPRVEGPIGTQPTQNSSSQTLPPVNPPNRTNGRDEDPGVVRSSESSPAQPSAPEPDPGVYNIEVRKNGPKPANTGAVAPSGAGVETLIRVGRQQFQLGNYSAAATSYQRALEAGGDPISLNQRLGQAYERLGRNSDAIAAYTRALGAIDVALGSGRGDRERLLGIQESCRQALRVLQGM